MDDPVSLLASMGDADLDRLLVALQDEIARRRVDAADVNALVELGFAKGFASKGLPLDPWVVSGLLICPGARIDASAMKHDCAFVHVGDSWVWEYPERVIDVVRTLPGPRQQMRSVTLLVAHEGLEIDVIVSVARTGVHQMKQVRSFVVKDGELVMVSARSPRTATSNR